MQPTAKYQPYQGYHYAQPHLWYSDAVPPKRIRTKGDWRYPSKTPDHYHNDHRFRAPHIEQCRGCGKVHCYWCHCDQPWKRWAHNSNDARHEKQLAHRTFRKQAKRLIQRELAGEEVSHNFIYSGDWLD